MRKSKRTVYQLVKNLGLGLDALQASRRLLSDILAKHPTPGQFRLLRQELKAYDRLIQAHFTKLARK